MTTKTKPEPPPISLNEMCSISIRRRGHLQAKLAAAVLNKEMRDVIESAIQYYLERKSPRALELFNEQHKKSEV